MLKRVLIFMAIVLPVFLFYGKSFATPQDHLEKLHKHFSKFQNNNAEGLPPCPLTQEETHDLVTWMTEEYQKAGHDNLSHAQVALMTGMIGGYKLGGDESTMGTAAAKVKGKRPLPAFDTDAYCNSVAQTSGGSYMIEAGCVDMERGARDAIASAMPNVPDQILAYCARVASTSGQSYTVMQGCIDMEMESKKRLAR